MTKYGRVAIIRIVRQPERRASNGGTKRSGHPVRPVVWIGSKQDLSALPREVKSSFGSRLYELQQGKMPLDIKPLSQFGSGVYEMRGRFDRNAYRMMYVVNLKKALYVLHTS